MIVYISIGNSDDKLTQERWSTFWATADTVINTYAAQVFGEWASLPVVPYQNACWCIQPKGTGRRLKDALRDLARDFRQDSISWAEVGEQTFLSHEDEQGYTP